jgi:hypothetical protein
VIESKMENGEESAFLNTLESILQVISFAKLSLLDTVTGYI